MTGNEWKTLLGMAGIFVGLFLAYGLFLLYHKRKNQKRLLARIRRDWGAWPEREYSYQEWENIQGYFRNKKTEEFQIDTITWEDLDMSGVFQAVNHSGSWIGDGYLYYLLHTPSFSEEELEKREDMVRFFTEHETERETVQQFFWNMGRALRVPIFDVIYNLAEAQADRPIVHIIPMLIMAASLGFLLINPIPGILAVILAMGWSMAVYFNKKRPVEKYVLSCSLLIRMLNVAEELEKLDMPQLKESQEKIRQARKAFGRLKRNSFFLIMSSRGDSDPAAGLILYFNSIFHIDLIQFSAVVQEMKPHIADFQVIVEEMGKIEAAISIASFRQSIDGWCLPHLEKGNRGHSGQEYLEAEGLYHPLIQDPVKNTIKTRGGVLVTGSNASGKSTFLKTVAVNAILAQTIHTCLADSWSGKYFRVYSSMALRDNLEGQESYYMVEIRSLKRILEQIPRELGREEEPPVLCFVDEVLRGTNTVERIAASSQVLRYMTGSGVLCFAATHDIELTHILEAHYANYHFQEEFRDGDIQFDYRLYPGRTESRNAIRLLQVMGYQESVVKRAQEEAEHFLRTGDWQPI